MPHAHPDVEFSWSRSVCRFLLLRLGTPCRVFTSLRLLNCVKCVCVCMYRYLCVVDLLLIHIRLFGVKLHSDGHRRVLMYIYMLWERTARAVSRGVGRYSATRE